MEREMTRAAVAVVLAIFAVQSAHCELVVLAVPAGQLPDGCRLAPVEPPPASTGRALTGLTFRAVPGDQPWIDSNPWRAARTEDKALVYRLISGSSTRLP